MRILGFLAIILQSVACLGQNLAQNPGFETGNTSGWTAFGSPTISVQTTQAHSGTYAAVVQNRTATWNGIAQSFAAVMQPGQTYSISAWLRLVSGTNETVQLTMKKTDANGDAYSAIGSGSISSTNWLQLSGQYPLTISGTLTGLTLYAEVPSNATASYFLDDLTVQTNGPGTGITGAVTVNWTDVRQRIDGFGASSAWRSTWSSSLADRLFSTNTGLGLSLLRTRIAPGATTVENAIMQLARDRGARVWSAPWTPQTSFKTPNQNGVISVNGGGFAGNVSNYQAYASQLAGYVANMKSSYGVTLYGLSIQNEPDFNTTNYESCVWTSQQVHDFVPYLSAALAASNAASTRIIIPESDIWSGDTALYTSAMNDANVAPSVSIIANHNYVQNNDLGDQSAPTAIPKYNKALWETEVSTSDAFDGSITNAMYWAKRIHSFLTLAQVNAWHYWWLCGSSSANSGLTDSTDTLAKRGYVLGQFSRFVRPDYYRIGVVTNVGSALVTAFKDPILSRLAIVAINTGNLVVTQTFTLNNVSGLTSLTPWLTSSSTSISSQPSVAVSNSFSYELPPMSVVTFVGQASNNPPAISSVANRTISAGTTLLITNSASDMDAPPQTLIFAVSQAPVNASLNSTNGVFTWRPSVAQANTTNQVAIRVTDSGSPALSATNNFTVTVAPLNQASLSSILISTAKTILTISGDPGPDYTLLTSTNLFDWQALLTTNPASLPVTVAVTNGTEPQRFYRIHLGP
jgi:glucuronoarabinoxylan endo-1,4-beta-xylanase